jgi:hypothetical protein
MIFLCYSKGVLECTFNVFTKLSHVNVTLFYVSERFTIFLTCMLIIKNLNVRCITINIFYNDFCKHGGEVVALLWTWPSSWTTCIGNYNSNITRWHFDYEDLLWEVVIRHIGMQKCYFLNLWAWMWTCEHEPMTKMEYFLTYLMTLMEYVKNIFYHIGQNLYWCGQIFIDVAKYFVTCKWMNNKWMDFLDEKILKNVICWTNLDNMGRWTRLLLLMINLYLTILYKFVLEVHHWANYHATIDGFCLSTFITWNWKGWSLEGLSKYLKTLYI